MRSGGLGRYRMTYRRSGIYVFKCEATDKDKLTGSSIMTVNVIDIRGNPYSYKNIALSNQQHQNSFCVEFIIAYL